MRGGTRDIVVIGASAGGIEALSRLVRGLPHELPAAVFVVVHQGPHRGSLAEVLARKGTIPAVDARNGGLISPQRIYVAPPDYHLTVKNHHMQLAVGPKVNRHRPAVDTLFESAAREYGERVIGIVLSGFLDDGTAGLAAIKRQGGITIVQDPDEAFAPDMPRNAARQVQIDYCLPAADIAPLLVKLVNGRENKIRK